MFRHDGFFTGETAINCIDGRTRDVIIDYMKQKYNLKLFMMQ
jgi:hypothetical protein